VTDIFNQILLTGPDLTDALITLTLAAVIGLYVLPGLLLSYAFLGHPLRRVTTATPADIAAATGLTFPASAVLVEAYGVPAGMDASCYFKLQMTPADGRTFMAQKRLKDEVSPEMQYPGFPWGSAPGRLKRRWADLSRAQHTRSWRESFGADDEFTVTVCLDDPAVTTVYVFVYYT